MRAGSSDRQSPVEQSPDAERPRARAAFAAALALVLLVLAACAPNAPQDYLEPVGKGAEEADRLWNIVLAVATLVFILVEGGILFFIFKFRRRSDKDAPVQTHGNPRAEFIWTLIPAVVLAIVAVPTVQGIFAFAEEPGGDRLDIKVVGKQWWWQYTYPGLGADGKDLVTANELHMPTGRPVYLDMTAEDVIHSFWVPKLSGKQDVVPGRQTALTLQTDQPGEYLGQCAEYCGDSHTMMRLKVFVHTPEDFERWLDEQRRAPAAPVSNSLAAEGAELFLRGRGDNTFGDPTRPACASCHAVAGTQAAGTTGPNLSHLMSRTTFAGSWLETNTGNLEIWLRNPPAVKPGSVMPNLHLTEDEIRALVAYLETLR